MDWSNEKYVRFYTRDTVAWLALAWQARALLPNLMRKLDRAGTLDLGRHGVRGLAALVALPVEVVEPGLASLLEDGCIEQHGAVLVMPNFIEAQEAAASDALRARESRARRRDAARRVGAPSAPPDEVSAVTIRDEASRTVTDGHDASRPVTLCCAVPSTPSLPSERARAPEHAHARTRDGMAADDGAIVLALDLPMPEPALARWRARELPSKLTGDPGKVWEAFVAHGVREGRVYASSEALVGAWDGWLIREARFQERERERRRAPPPPPDPPRPRLKTVTEIAREQAEVDARAEAWRQEQARKRAAGGDG